MVGHTLYYGASDQMMYKRSFDGSVLGPANRLHYPYHPPAWTSTYDGQDPGFFQALPDVTGMAFWHGRIYYTLLGERSLFYRYFTPDSGVVGATQFVVPTKVSFLHVKGMFIVGRWLYYAAQGTGDLRKVAWVAGVPQQGTTHLVSTKNFHNQALFLFDR
jgi:hypothetical protein